MEQVFFFLPRSGGGFPRPHRRWADVPALALVATDEVGGTEREALLLAVGLHFFDGGRTERYLFSYLFSIGRRRIFFLFKKILLARERERVFLFFLFLFLFLFFLLILILILIAIVFVFGIQ